MLAPFQIINKFFQELSQIQTMFSSSVTEYEWTMHFKRSHSGLQNITEQPFCLQKQDLKSCQLLAIKNPKQQKHILIWIWWEKKKFSFQHLGQNKAAGSIQEPETNFGEHIAYY